MVTDEPTSLAHKTKDALCPERYPNNPSDHGLIGVRLPMEEIEALYHLARTSHLSAQK